MALRIISFSNGLYCGFNSESLRTNTFLLEQCLHANCSNFAAIWSLSGRRNIDPTTKYIPYPYPIDLRVQSDANYRSPYNS